MKKLLMKILVLFSVIYLLSGCKPSAKEAAKYNDTIVYYQTIAFKSINNFYAQMENAMKKPLILDTAYEQAAKNIKMAVEKLQEIGDFHGDSTLYKSADTLFNTYMDVLNNQLSEILRLYKIPMEQYTKQDQKQLENAITISQKRLDMANKRFIEAQKHFADTYQLDLR